VCEGTRDRHEGGKIAGGVVQLRRWKLRLRLLEDEVYVGAEGVGIEGRWLGGWKRRRVFDPKGW